MELMMTIVYDYLKKHGAKNINDIFKEVDSKQKEYWKKSLPHLTIAKIQSDKLGELFTYLTTDGRFVMVDDVNWSLADNFSFDKIKKMRINMGFKKEK